MIMPVINDISLRLHKLNAALAEACRQKRLAFDGALRFALFYRDCKDTNIMVAEAETLAASDADALFQSSLSLLSETETYLSTDKEVLRNTDFEALFNEHTAPFKKRHEEAKDSATELWRKYSSMAGRLDFLPLDSEEYKALDKECDNAKAEYDKAHSLSAQLYDEWREEEKRCFCVYCFNPMFMDVLVMRIKTIAESIAGDIKRMKEGDA